MHCKVTAVVVSYNREVLLSECLDGLAAQTRPIDRLVVVDNASTDGARGVLRAHSLTKKAYEQDDVSAHDAEVPTHARKFVSADGTVIVHELNRNVGGAGGFCAGLAQAVVAEHEPKNQLVDVAKATASASVVSAHTSSIESAHAEDAVEAEFVWLMDDDTVPTPTALEELLGAVDRCVAVNGIVPTVMGSRASWTDGREHLMNKPRERTWIAKGHRYLPLPIVSEAHDDEQQPFQVRSLSFVSCLINAQAVRDLHRLPKAAYFLWNDDYEFTTALLRYGIGYYVPQSEVIHKTKVFGSSDADPGERFYQEVRNKLWLMRTSAKNFCGVEFVEFLLKTMRRWALTWWRSEHRDVIVRCLKRGIADGFKGRPAANEEVFAGMSDVQQLVRQVEQ